MLPHDNFLRTFVEIADTMTSGFDLIDFLTLLVERAARISGADAAGVLLDDGNGHLGFVAVSNEEARVLELLQSQAERGPCFDAFSTGEPVVNSHLDEGAARARWPEFAPAAVEHGFAAVHALPIRLRDVRIGALNLFTSDGSDLDDEGVLAVQAMADIAAISIIYERSLRQATAVKEQLQGALESRVVIEQAKGALAQHHRIAPDEAFGLLRAYARHHQLKLGELCVQVMNEPQVMAAVADLGEPVA